MQTDNDNMYRSERVPAFVIAAAVIAVAVFFACVWGAIQLYNLIF